jgi:cobalt-zinc-cadmium efflux system outer membrane protein
MDMMDQKTLAQAAGWLAPVVLVCAMPFSVPAQTLLPPPSPVPQPSAQTPVSPLSLDDLLNISLENNPSLRQAGFDIEAAQGRSVQAGLYPNPTVQVIGEQLGGRTATQGVVSAPLITQEIVTAGKLRLSRAVGQREVDQATLALLRQRYALFTTVRQGYFEVLANQRRVDVLTDLEKLAKQSYDNAKKFQGAGEASKPDVLQFEVELDRLQTDQEAARREVAASWRRLAASMGVPKFPQQPLLGSLEAAVPDYDFDRAAAQMLDVHPEIRSAEVGIIRAQLAVRRAEVERIPNVTLGAGYTRDSTLQPRQNEWRFEVGVPVPLFNRNQGNIRAAQAELGRATQEVPRVQNELANRLATAFGQYTAAKQRAERYQKSILPKARESYRLTLAAFRGGQFEYLRVLQAQRAIGEANLSYIQALSEQWRAASEIAGLLQEEHWPPAVPRPNPAP